MPIFESDVPHSISDGGFYQPIIFMDKNTEPAFPMLDPNGSYTQYGLSKREYLAALAMVGLRSSKLQTTYRGAISLWDSKSIARQAVSDADALINELNK